MENSQAETSASDASASRSMAAAFAAMACAIILWASAFAGIRTGLAAFSPGHLALFRFLCASAALAAYAAVVRIPLPERKDIPRIALLGFFWITVYHTALNYGEVTVSAGAASFLINATPVITAVLAAVFLREKVTPFGWLGIVVSFGGAALIAWGEGEGVRFDAGALWVLVAAVASALSIVIQKPLLQRYSALPLTAYLVWAGTLPLLVFLPGLTGAITDAPLSASMAVVYLGVFPGAVAYASWAYFLSIVPVSRAASFLYLSPPVAVLIAWLWLGEMPTLFTLAGGVLALSGVVIVNRWGR
ncbi:MAG: protein of unknown function transrane [Anaerosporomusa subterranea]|nr:protein of unknown function transrane [Anaerosporomusa subterranea]